MKVAVVGPKAPPMGGMALQTEALVAHLRTEQTEVVFIPCNPDNVFSWLGKIPVVRALLRLLCFWRALRRDLNGVTLVHVMANSGWSWYFFAVPAIRVAHAKGLPIVLNYRGGHAETFFAQSFIRIKKDLSLCDTIAVPSNYLKEIFARYGEKAHEVPNILDVKRFSPSARHSEGLNILITRNLESIYGIDSAIRAFAEVLHVEPNAHLRICGEGPEKQALTELASTLGISHKLTFLGRLQRSELIEELAKARLLLNPSRVDNSPNSLIESMACGLPIVSTNAGGIPHLVTHETEALLVDVDDTAGMTKAILRAHQDTALRQQLISAGLEKAQQFSWPNVWEKLNAVYHLAMQHRKHRHA